MRSLRGLHRYIFNQDYKEMITEQQLKKKRKFVVLI